LKGFEIEKSQKERRMKSLQEKRNSGIPLVGPLPWGSHFCQFYETQKDLLDILVPYLRAGLENNEISIWVTSDFLAQEEALKALRKEVPQFETYLNKKQIEIFPYTDWYLKGGSFDLKRTLRMWMDKHNEALARGFDGIRVTGNPYWIDNKKDWDDFAEYEAEINNVIGGTKMLVLCTYSLKKCGVAEIVDVVKNHEFALAVNNGAWQMVSSPSFKLN
jgi:hypothetical protein